MTLYGSVSECVPDPCFVTTKPTEEATTDIRGNFALDISKARATTMTIGIPPEPRFKRVQVPPANGTLYLIASGGNAGKGINPAIKLATFLGSVPAGRHVVINELTTALAFLCSGRISAFPGGMAPFALDLFLRLVDPANARLRAFPGTPSNSPALVNTVANALNACVASEGPTSKECADLLQATSPVRFNNKATDTLSAAESIVFHPDRNLRRGVRDSEAFLRLSTSPECASGRMDAFAEFQGRRATPAHRDNGGEAPGQTVDRQLEQ